VRIGFSASTWRRIPLLLCLGGGSIFFWLGAVLAGSLGASATSQYYSSTYEWATLLALVVYQPHFIATYQLNYTRGWSHLRHHWPTLIALPAAMVIIIANSLLTAGALSQLRLQGLLALVLIAGVHHFACQSAAATIHCSGKSPAREQSLLLRGVFFVTGLYGWIRHTQYLQGEYALFGIRLSVPEISAWPLDVAGALLLMAHAGLAVHSIRMRWSAVAAIPWLALVLWYTSPVFLKQYFYLVPVMHGLQFFPFYLDRRPEIKTLWRLASLVAISLLVVFAAPNLMPGATGFAAVLFALNLHHFAMERVTWRNNHSVVGGI
jgi:hypothetical protein